MFGRRVLFSLTLFSCVGSHSAFAVNVLYLPGDAFFPTSLTKENVEQLKKSSPKERAFGYSSLGGYSFAFCGYSGYGKVVFEDMDEEFFSKLTTVYQDIRDGAPRDLREIKEEDGTTRYIELNSVGVLFYPATTPKNAVLGLRYNEDWVEEMENLKHPRERQRLCCLIDDPKAVMLSWRDAKVFPTFQIDRTSFPAQGYPDKQAPLRIRGAVRAVVIGFSTPDELFKTDEYDWHEVHTITADGIEARREEYGNTKILPWRKHAGKWLPPKSVDWDNLDIDDDLGDEE